MRRFKYYHFHKKGSVGVANFIHFEKIDIITYTLKFSIHRQIEIRNNLVFMRIKKKALNALIR